MTTVTIPSTITAEFARIRAEEFVAVGFVQSAQLWSAVADALESDHDFDPVWEGCSRCAALPGDEDVCEPPVKWVSIGTPDGGTE